MNIIKRNKNNEIFKELFNREIVVDVERIKNMYESLDGGHKFDHIVDVFNASKELCYKLNLNNTITVSALLASLYHDIGLIRGRDLHHEYSASIFISEVNDRINHNLSPKDIEIIHTAISQHRSTFKGERETYVSMILSDADRLSTLEMPNMVRRAVYYTISNNPEYNMQDVKNEVFCHLSDKFSKGARGTKLYFEQYNPGLYFKEDEFDSEFIKQYNKIKGSE